MKVYQIEGSSYDGCNGWEEWICKGVYTTKENAQKHIDDKLQGSYSRYNVIEVEVID